jgi:hypothetical protein
MYMVTRRLWLPIATHVAWNYCVGQLFSGAVSGHGEEIGLLKGSLSGPVWLTGGEFGIEGSVATLVIISLATAWLLRRAMRDGQIVLPYWRKPAAA